jgi:hypothetical protein
LDRVVSLTRSCELGSQIGIIKAYTIVEPFPPDLVLAKRELYKLFVKLENMPFGGLPIVVLDSRIEDIFWIDIDNI